jgi:hypothetical protein
MHYMVIVRDRKGEPFWLHEDLLDGLVPDRVIDLMTCEVAEDFGLCAICESGGRRCHVMLWIAPHCYAKYCPVLWHDVFKPTTWKVEELV